MCVIVNVFLALALIYILPLANSVAPAAVVGINKITLSGPTRKSLTAVDVALLVIVTVAVAFNLPDNMLFTTSDVSLWSL